MGSSAGRCEMFKSQRCTLALFSKRQKQEMFINVVIAYMSVENPAMELAEATVMLQTGNPSQRTRTKRTVAIRRNTLAMRNELCCIHAQPL